MFTGVLRANQRELAVRWWALGKWIRNLGSKFCFSYSSAALPWLSYLPSLGLSFFISKWKRHASYRCFEVFSTPLPCFCSWFTISREQLGSKREKENPKHADEIPGICDGWGHITSLFFPVQVRFAYWPLLLQATWGLEDPVPKWTRTSRTSSHTGRKMS